MARPRKNATPPAASLAERLRSALVPEEEQPYPVPANWCWVRLGTLITAFKEKTDNFFVKNLQYIGLENIEKDGKIMTSVSANNLKSLKNVFRKDQILYGRLRPYLNKHGIPTFDGVCSTDILVFDNTKFSLNKFVNYYFDLSFFIDYAVANCKGINLPRVSEETILKAPAPLPPLAEQQRIVERIETLFARLDEAKGKLEEIRDGHEARRAAILHKAFTGELTAKWREAHGVGLESWEEKTLGEVCEINPSRNTDTTLQNSTEVSFVPMNAVSEVTGSIIIYQTRNYGDVKNGYTCFREGDVIFAKITPCMENGKSAIVGKLVNNI